MGNQSQDISPAPNLSKEPKSLIASKPAINDRVKSYSVFKFVLIILFVALCSGGVYYWQHSKVTSLNVQETGLINQIAKLQKEIKTTTSTSSSTTPSSPTSLVIQEWGIKMPLSSPISDAYYYFNNGYAYLSVQSLSNTQCAANSTSEGVIGRFSPTDLDPQTNKTLLSEHSTDSVRVGSYYYFYTHPQSGCSSDLSILNQASIDIGAFEQAVLHIQAQ